MLRHVVFRFLLCCVFALPAWSAASRGGMAAESGSLSATSTLQLYARLESWDRQLRPLDLSTLQDRQHDPAIRLGSPGGYQPSTVLASDDGTTLVAISYAPSDGNATGTQSITIRVINARTGARRPLFHPAVAVWVDGISSDGSQLFGFRSSTDAQQRPEWVALSAADGAVMQTLQLEPGCCSGGSLYDAADHRLYAMEMPSGATASVTSGNAAPEPVTPILVAYDLAAGHEIGRVSLDGVLMGSTTVTQQAGNPPLFRNRQPALALSPHGSQIAVLDGESDRLLLVDTRRLEIVRSAALTRPQSPLERLGEALGVLPESASAKEWLGAQLSMRYSPDGRYLYVTGRKGEIGADGKWTVSGLGLRLVDVAGGQVLADTLSGHWVVDLVPAPDGSAIYSESWSPMGGSPVTLRRHDPSTLAATAERRFDDPAELYFLARPAPLTPSWLQSWPMAGHDPQRSNRSPVSGPVDPGLLFQRKALYPALVGPDGSIYAGSRKGLVTLDAQGHELWTARECCGEGPPALAPNGMILGTGFRHGPPASQEDTEAIGIGPDGKLAWRIQPFGVLKGAVPLVTDANLLYLPIVGPAEADAAGLDVMAADGKLLQKLPRALGLALAPDGTIVSVDLGGSLAARSPDGKLLWQHPLKTEAYGVVGPLVGHDGVVYLGNSQEVDAFAASGRMLWRYRKADQALALAERSDGVLLVAGRHALDAVRPDGKQLWKVQIGNSRGAYAGERPSLIVDGDDTAYVGSGDGLIRVISMDGRWLSSLSGGLSTHHLTPGLILGPDGRLIVSGADGVMRVYGP